MAESKSSINIEEIKRMQPLYHSLAKLFQFLGNDEFKQKISESERLGLVVDGKKKMSVRQFYEKVLADTPTQMKLATATQIKPQEVSSLSNPHRLPIGFDTIRLKSELEAYKKNYCWLSGVRITDSDGNLLAPYPKIHCNSKEKLNEDEHAISFYYMLFMFGGISSVPQTFNDTKYSSILSEATKKVKELINNNVINTDLELYEGAEISVKDASLVHLLRTNNTSIGNLGSDSTLYSRTFDFSLELTRCMNVDHHKLIGNKTSLNSLGLWLSFCYLNQFKTNYNFYRLSFEIMRDSDTDEPYLYNPYFRTSNTRIDNFVEFVDIIKSGNDDGAKAFSKAIKPELDIPVKKGNRIFFYPRKTKALALKYQNQFRNDPHIAPYWDSGIAKNNIKTIMDLLCNEGSTLLVHRIFYNCVIAYYLQSKILAKDKKKVTTKQWANKTAPGIKGEKRNEKNERIMMTTDVFSQARTNNADKIFTNDYSNLPSIMDSRGDDVEKNDIFKNTYNNIIDFIKNYIICHGLDISTIKHDGLRDMLAILVLDQTVEYIPPPSQNLPVSLQPPRPSAPVYTPQPAVVIKDHQPIDDILNDEIPLTKGENVMILEKAKEGAEWTRARSSTGEGYIPIDNVELDAIEEEEEEEDEEDDASSSPLPSPPSSLSSHDSDFLLDIPFEPSPKPKGVLRQASKTGVFQPPRGKRRKLSKGGKKKTKKRKYKKTKKRKYKKTKKRKYKKTKKRKYKKTKKNIVKKQRKGKRKKKTRKLN